MNYSVVNKKNVYHHMQLLNKSCTCSPGSLLLSLLLSLILIQYIDSVCDHDSCNRVPHSYRSICYFAQRHLSDAQVEQLADSIIYLQLLTILTNVVFAPVRCGRSSVSVPMDGQCAADR